MANTILEKLQEKYPDVPGINDARNIAEAVACINGTGGRGANAIADYIDAKGLSTVLHLDSDPDTGKDIMVLVINERAEDRESNIAKYGEVVKEYEPLSPIQPYKFDAPDDVLWYSKREEITSVKIGSPITPEYTVWWFYNLSACTSMDLNGLDMSNVKSMENMISGCSALTSLDVSGFDTSKVENMRGVFQGCSALTSLDVSGFDTSNVTDVTNMFGYCSALTNLDVSGFDTSNVTSMHRMFQGCSTLTSIDVSNFDTSKVNNMVYMFGQCSELETINASDKFVTTALGSGSNYMFKDCYKLVGGNGTTYSEDHDGSEYARIDTAETPGYFTAASA